MIRRLTSFLSLYSKCYVTLSIALNLYFINQHITDHHRIDIEAIPGNSEQIKTLKISKPFRNTCTSEGSWRLTTALNHHNQLIVKYKKMWVIGWLPRASSSFFACNRANPKVAKRVYTPELNRAVQQHRLEQLVRLGLTDISSEEHLLHICTTFERQIEQIRRKKQAATHQGKHTQADSLSRETISPHCPKRR